MGCCWEILFDSNVRNKLTFITGDSGHLSPSNCNPCGVSSGPRIEKSEGERNKIYDKDAKTARGDGDDHDGVGQEMEVKDKTPADPQMDVLVEKMMREMLRASSEQTGNEDPRKTVDGDLCDTIGFVDVKIVMMEEMERNTTDTSTRL